MPCNNSQKQFTDDPAHRHAHELNRRAAHRASRRNPSVFVGRAEYHSHLRTEAGLVEPRIGERNTPPGRERDVPEERSRRSGDGVLYAQAANGMHVVSPATPLPMRHANVETPPDVVTSTDYGSFNAFGGPGSSEAQTSPPLRNLSTPTTGSESGHRESPHTLSPAGQFMAKGGPRASLDANTSAAFSGSPLGGYGSVMNAEQQTKKRDRRSLPFGGLNRRGEPSE
jgi:hypothetical protein